MTNPIGTGTKNLSANVPIDEWAELHALARKMGCGIGAAIKDLIFKGTEATDPEAARRIKAARRQYYGAAILGLFLGLIAIGNQHEPRRVCRVRRPQIRREVVA